MIGASFSRVCCVTLGLFRRDFGEEGHLRHGHKREPQQLEKDPDDEGRQLPSVPTWRKDGGAVHGILTHICAIAPVNYFNTAASISASGSNLCILSSVRLQGPSHKRAGTGGDGSI